MVITYELSLITRQCGAPRHDHARPQMRPERVAITHPTNPMPHPTLQPPRTRQEYRCNPQPSLKTNDARNQEPRVAGRSVYVVQAEAAMNALYKANHSPLGDYAGAASNDSFVVSGCSSVPSMPMLANS